MTTQSHMIYGLAALSQQACSYAADAPPRRDATAALSSVDRVAAVWTFVLREASGARRDTKRRALRRHRPCLSVDLKPAQCSASRMSAY